MPLNYRNLDQRTRALAATELASDIAAKAIYMSPRLSAKGAGSWPSLLSEAIAFHDDTWLANEVRHGGLMNTHEERRKPKGGTTVAQVPATAPDTLAEGEFNRYYVRGLCLRAIEDKLPHVEVYRARHSENPRPESQVLIGKHFSPDALLNDIRTSPGVEPALGVQPGPNSGLSVCIP